MNDNLQGWENIYNSGNHLNRYPYDAVVTFVNRYYPKEKPRNTIEILELGCGSGNNLWFAAREGFSVYGVDGSHTAVDFARTRFEKEGLSGRFEVGDIADYNFSDSMFDLVIDRASLTCCPYEKVKKAIRELHGNVKVGGKFYFNPYSDHHGSFMAGDFLSNGCVGNIREGLLVGVGEIHFYNKSEILELFAEGWKILSMNECIIRDEYLSASIAYSDWRVIVERV